MSNRTLAIVNDSEVTTGSLPKDITSINAWEIDWDALSLDDTYIILGGHMGSYDDKKFPYLQKEKQWLKKAINSDTKILGICLGSQLIADAMGGKAYLSEQIEFGFKDLNFIEEDSLFEDFKNSKVFSWHRDTFEIPPGATLVAKTNFPQIYKIKNTIALQFHPEIKLNLFETWYDSELSKQELECYDVKSEVQYLKDNSQQQEKSMINFYTKWMNINLYNVINIIR
jgi:GMP synthase-like glutamine amidotransferase